VHLHCAISFYKCRDIKRCASTREVLRRRLTSSSDVNHRLFTLRNFFRPGHVEYSRRVSLRAKDSCLFSARCYLNASATIYRVLHADYRPEIMTDFNYIACTQINARCADMCVVCIIKHFYLSYSSQICVHRVLKP